jgi:site-specific recombinase XerD
MPKKPSPVVGVYEREPGSDIWHARIRMEGKLVRKSFGRGPKGRDAAIAWVEKARTIKRTGGGVLSNSAKKAVRTTEEVAILGDQNAVTVGKLCDEFEKYVRDHPDEYWDQVNPPRLIGEVRNAFGERDAATVTPPEIETWLNKIQKERKLGNGTINKIMGKFSKIYQHGARFGLITPMNPVWHVPTRTPPPPVERYLSDEEEERLLAAIQARIDSYDPVREPILRNRAIACKLEFFIATRMGLRRGEQYRILWSDVHLDRGVVRLPKTKNKKRRNAYVIADVVEWFRELRTLDVGEPRQQKGQPDRAKQGYVFAKKENRTWWAAVIKAAKIKNYRWHDNRHTFCSRLVQAGVRLEVVRDAAGHASLASTDRYSHLAPSQTLNAMAVLNRKPEAAKPTPPRRGRGKQT